MKNEKKKKTQTVVKQLQQSHKCDFQQNKKQKKKRGGLVFIKCGMPTTLKELLLRPVQKEPLNTFKSFLKQFFFFFLHSRYELYCCM